MALPDLQPVLSGPRILVRPLQATDWSDLQCAAADPEIWALHPVRERYKETVFREFFDTAIEAASAFAFVDRSTGQIVGSSRYYGYDATISEIEIGWTFLTRAYWGGSYNAEVKRLMLDHAFTFADTVVFWVGEENWRSQRAMEKIGGAKRAGMETRAYGGQDFKHMVFEIRKSRYDPARLTNAQ